VGGTVVGHVEREAEYRLTRRFNVRIPLRDGVTLAADLTLPAQLPAPAVVCRTPYGRSNERQVRFGDRFARAGYVAVWVDVRGRGDSDGRFEPYRNDGLDGYDVIQWVAAQPWCDGGVASWGGSYGGRIQWLAALQRPPALKAMIVEVAPSDPFVEDPTGVPGPMRVNWHRLTDGRMPQYTEPVDWMEVYRHRPLRELDRAAGFQSDRWADEVGHDAADDAYWEPLRYQHRIAEIDLPVLHISGWYDDEEIGTPANFAAMTAAGRVGQRLLMGPWGHRVNSSRQLGEVDFGPEALIDLDRELVAFLDRHVRDMPPARPEPPVRIFVMGAGEWRGLPSWPPPGAATLALYLDSDGHANSRFGDGRLQSRDTLPADAPADQWRHDPDRPVPFITEASSAQIGGPDDYAGVQTRGDVLVYTGEPLTEPLDVIGPVRLVAHVATSAADTDICAMLLDVHPSGFAQRLCDGVVRLSRRDGADAPAAVVAEAVYEVEIEMWDTAQRFLRGHRIGLQVASSAHPKYGVNLGTEGDQTVQVAGVTARNRLFHDHARPSRLLLSTS
jgi:putative CocE/NonD family hydrolase